MELHQTAPLLSPPTPFSSFSNSKSSSRQSRRLLSQTLDAHLPKSTCAHSSWWTATILSYNIKGSFFFPVLFDLACESASCLLQTSTYRVALLNLTWGVKNCCCLAGCRDVQCKTEMNAGGEVQSGWQMSVCKPSDLQTELQRKFARFPGFTCNWFINNKSV